jgi:transcriptional regulator with GAF, ATPase, and Fis domain
MWTEEGNVAVTAEPRWARELGDPAVTTVLEELTLGRAAQAVEKARALLRGRETSDGQTSGRRLALGVALAALAEEDAALSKEAVRILADAASWAEREGHRAALAEARLQGGRARARQGEHVAALMGVETALKDYGALGDAEGTARARCALGRLRAATMDPAMGAKDLLQGAADLAKTGATTAERTAVLAEAAAAFRRAGDLEAARRAAIAARATADESEDAGLRATTRAVESELRLLAGDLEAARKSAEGALELARASGERGAGARALLALGTARGDGGEVRAARDLLERAAKAAHGHEPALAARAAAFRVLLDGDVASDDDVRAAADEAAQAAAEAAGRARQKGASLEAPLLARAAEAALEAVRAALAPDRGARLLEAARAAERAEAWDLALRARARGTAALIEAGETNAARAAADALEAAAKAASAPLWVARARVLRSRAGATDAPTLRDAATQAERRGALPLARDAWREVARTGSGDLAARAVERLATIEASLRASGGAAPSAPAPKAGEDVLEREDLLRLVRLLARLTESTEPDLALADIVDAAIELTGARRGLVYLRGPGGAFVLSARGRGGEPLDPAEETASATVVQATVEGLGVVASDDASADERFKGATSVLALGQAAVLCAPLAVRGKTIGALYVDAKGAQVRFDARARALLERFAQAAALAVASARERRLLDGVLDAPLDVDELLDAALALLVELTGAARGRVLEVAGQELRVRAARGDEATRAAPLPRAAVLQALELGAALVLDDQEDGARSVALAPIVQGGRALAVLLLEHPEARAFSSADRDLLARAARRLARPVANALEHRALTREAEGTARALEETLRRLGEGEATRAIVGEDPAVRRALELVARVADRDVPVLIHGESGTGKELFARALHFGSRRKGKPFVAQSCGGLGGPLLESELFGHEKGSFTGATESRTGLFEAAHGGTLLLDEVSDLAPDVQAKLLRVLETGEVRAIGAAQARKVDVRVLATTRADLRGLVEQGRFREDLYYRLTTVHIEVPALRRRRDDILVLARAFLERAARERSEPVRELTPGARRAILEHDWPGNVRELENTILRAVALAPGDKVTVQDLVLDGAAPLAPPPAALAELSRRQEAAVEAARDGRVLTAASYRELARVSKRTAIRDLNDLVERGWLARDGRGSAVVYRLAPGK